MSQTNKPLVFSQPTQSKRFMENDFGAYRSIANHENMRITIIGSKPDGLESFTGGSSEETTKFSINDTNKIFTVIRQFEGDEHDEPYASENFIVNISILEKSSIIKLEIDPEVKHGFKHVYTFDVKDNEQVTDFSLNVLTQSIKSSLYFLKSEDVAKINPLTSPDSKYETDDRSDQNAEGYLDKDKVSFIESLEGKNGEEVFSSRSSSGKWHLPKLNVDHSKAYLLVVEGDIGGGSSQTAGSPGAGMTAKYTISGVFKSS